MIDESYRQFDQAMAIPEGWVAPELFARDKQIICLPLSCRNSPAFFQTTLDRTTPRPGRAVLGPRRQIFLPVAIFPADIWSPGQPG
ncbi:MAG TPA: hypothetical protein DIT01_19110 [Lentisphaeria bacterium]|nr:hypothetical protein [Lentisphaeria bacterium]